MFYLFSSPLKSRYSLAEPDVVLANFRKRISVSTRGTHRSLIPAASIPCSRAQSGTYIGTFDTGKLLVEYINPVDGSSASRMEIEVFPNHLGGSAIRFRHRIRRQEVSLLLAIVLSIMGAGIGASWLCGFLPSGETYQAFHGALTCVAAVAVTLLFYRFYSWQDEERLQILVESVVRAADREITLDSGSDTESPYPVSSRARELLHQLELDMYPCAICPENAQIT